MSHSNDFGEFLQVRLFCRRVLGDDLKRFTKKPCSDKVALCLCSQLAIESDKFLLVFRIRYPDVPPAHDGTDGTSAVWLLLFLLFRRNGHLVGWSNQPTKCPLRRKAIFHTSAWRGNDLKEMIKESPANINLRGLYHSHSYAIKT